MSFPVHDRCWTDAAAFLEVRVRPADRVLAPDQFWWRLGGTVHRWVPANLDDPSRFDWVVIHKGEVPAFPRPFLEAAVARGVAVFANEVFVVLARPERAGPPVADTDDVHVDALRRLVRELPDEPAIPNPHEGDAILGAEATVSRFRDLDDRSLRSAQEAFFADGGYRYPTRRDQGYYDDVHRHLGEALAGWAGRRVLEVASAAAELPPTPDGLTVVRTDFAAGAIARARDADGRRSGCSYAVTDAHQLAFADATFDAAAFVDAIEHVRDAEAVLGELGRVVRPGGELLLTFANRDSLNQVLTRSLGYPEFVTNHQHIREFTLGEVVAGLDAAGFVVERTAGILLSPYWGIPGIDDVVRPVIDDDPEVVDLLRRLGELVGAEHAYTGVVLARRS